jgi:MarR family transcriptional regulator, lower aerobic nicotinate degradation pathway regulator
MRREKLNIVTPAADAAEHGRYVLDDQVGFLLRVTLQRHTSIFTTRMIEGLTQTQFAALAKLHEVGPCSQNHLGQLIYLDAATIRAWSTGWARAAWSPRSTTRTTAAAARWRSPTAAAR